MPGRKGQTPALIEEDEDGQPLDFGPSGPRHSSSVEKRFAVLACFTAKRPLLGVAEVADKTGLSRSTAHRYMTTLVELGYLEQYTNRKYRVGLRGHDIGLAVVDAWDSPARARADGRSAAQDRLDDEPCRIGRQ